MQHYNPAKQKLQLHHYTNHRIHICVLVNFKNCICRRGKEHMKERTAARVTAHLPSTQLILKKLTTHRKIHRVYTKYYTLFAVNSNFLVCP
jgi:hypothetical protein